MQGYIFSILPPPPPEKIYIFHPICRVPTWGETRKNIILDRGGGNNMIFRENMYPCTPPPDYFTSHIRIGVSRYRYTVYRTVHLCCTWCLTRWEEDVNLATHNLQLKQKRIFCVRRFCNRRPSAYRRIFRICIAMTKFYIWTPRFMYLSLIHR